MMVDRTLKLKLKTPNFIANLVNEAHIKNRAFSVIVTAGSRVKASRGIGKSVFSIRTLYHIYQDWDTVFEHIVFTPHDFIGKISSEGRIKALVWDDAGYWLNRRYWNDRLVKATMRLLQVTRPAVTCIIFTTPRIWELPTPVLDQVEYIVTIEKHKGEYDRCAKVYFKFEPLTFRKIMTEKIANIYFDVRLPDNIYKRYSELRNRYVDQAILDFERACDENDEENNIVSDDNT